ncbi:13106_t:CDS:2, partial [Entrophospora sp. SA101]
IEQFYQSSSQSYCKRATQYFTLRQLKNGHLNIFMTLQHVKSHIKSKFPNNEKVDHIDPLTNDEIDIDLTKTHRLHLSTPIVNNCKIYESNDDDVRE